MYQQLPFLQQFRLRAAVGWHTFLVAATMFLPASGFAGGIELDSREYKLMLRPTEFTAADPQQGIERFIKEQTLLHGSVVRRRGLDGISGARS